VADRARSDRHPAIVVIGPVVSVLLPVELEGAPDEPEV
jgi:hypothetical protein